MANARNAKSGLGGYGRLVLALLESGGGRSLPGVLRGSPASRTMATEELPRVRAGRNEPCPCSSGKKFKRCCRREVR